MRLFFAIELPDEARARIVDVREAMRLDRARWRPVRAEALHLTVRFVGEVDPARVEALAACARTAAAGVERIPCEVAGVGAFPPSGRARILWVGIEDRSAGGDLARLARRLEQELRGAGLPQDGRAFAPHVTIARARGPARAPRGDPSAPIAAFRASELRLLRSHLGPAGSRYELVEAFPMCQDAGGGGT